MSFDPTDRWDFRDVADTTWIQAHVEDETYWEAIDRREVLFGKGHTLRAVFRVTEYLHDGIDYEIVQVLEHLDQDGKAIYTVERSGA